MVFTGSASQEQDLSPAPVVSGVWGRASAELLSDFWEQGNVMASVLSMGCAVFHNKWNCVCVHVYYVCVNMSGGV